MGLMEELKTPATEHRKRALKEARLRARKIEHEYPEVKKIKEQMRELTKRYYYGRVPWNEDAQEITEDDFLRKKQKLKEKLNQVLDKHGIPKDYGQPDYRCEKCNDKGRINGELCECEKKRLRNLKAYRIFKKAGVPDQRRKDTFENFNFKYYSETEKVQETGKTQRTQAREIYNQAKTFCQKVKDREETQGLYIWGDVGAGKSYIAFSIANSLINKGIPVLYRTYDRLISEIQRTYSQQNVATMDVLESIFDIDVLILDDLGVEIPSEDSASKLYQILNERASALSPTIITSNYSLGQVGGRYKKEITGKRIVRRIAELCSIYKLEAKGDITLIKKGGKVGS